MVVTSVNSRPLDGFDDKRLLAQNNTNDDNGDSIRTKQQLAHMGVYVLEPETRQQMQLAQAMADFATFCLHDEQEKCRAIIDKHMAMSEHEQNEEEGPSIGELQGGSDEFDIYRLSFPTTAPPQGKNNSEDSTTNAAMELLQTFITTSSIGKQYRNILTFDSMQRYIMEMCQRRLLLLNNNSNRQRVIITRLTNVMLILAFGSTQGQPRHIDHMHPNISIFLFMSENCPSTILYDTTTTTTTTTTNTTITNTQLLVQYWQEQFCQNNVTAVPTLLQTVLNRHGSTKLQTMLPLLLGHHQFGSSISCWDTIDVMLQNFGKLYQSISARPYALKATRPGTTMVVGGGGDESHVHTGNYVHAGPPTNGPRMLCFAVGILKDEDEYDNDDDEDDMNDKETDDDDEDANNNNNEKKENDGEMQYNPVLFHADLCCILFTIMDHHCHDDKDKCQQPDKDDNDDDLCNNDNDENEKYQAKWFLLYHVLVPLIKGLCNDHIDYERLLGNERLHLRDWLQRLTIAVVSNDSPIQVQGLVQEAITNKSIFSCSDSSLVSNKSKSALKKNKMARRNNKQARGGVGKKQAKNGKEKGG